MPISPSIAQISWREFLQWLWGRRKRVTVINRSMLPTLKPGDEVLFDNRWQKNMDLKAGDIVVFHHPSQPQLYLIKRITDITSNHQIELRGDNPDESIDSRQFGLVPTADVIGKVTCIFSSS